MNHTTKYIGFDVSKETIAISIANAGRDLPYYHSTIQNTPQAIRKFMSKFEGETVEVCYESGPTGYTIYRQLYAMGIPCMVCATSLTPVRPGDKVKTDKRDSLRLAQLFRSGELTAVHVPTEEDEALRDLARLYQDMKEDLHRAKQRLLKFLDRSDLARPAGMRNWSSKHWTWLSTIVVVNPVQKKIFAEYIDAIKDIQVRIKRVETEIDLQATESKHAHVIQELQTLRGIKVISAFLLVAEIGDFTRFQHPKKLMAYAGLVPKEYSSGASRKQGGITKSGNANLRWILDEIAWAYRYPAKIQGDLEKRQKGKSDYAQQKAWTAQKRLCKKYARLIARGKHSCKAVTAIARELCGFIWAIACRAQGKLVFDRSTAVVAS